jgi:hypothetical protein
MKKLLTILLLCFFTISNAQDVIIYKDGSEKKVKVLKINPDEIVFKKYNALNGPEYTESKSTIFMIKYEGGDKDVFNNSDMQNTTTKQTETSEETNYTLFSGTTIEIYLTHDVSSQNLRNGDIIRFAVKNGITSGDGKQIVTPNTYVEGRVVSSEKAKAGGVKGELDIMVSSIPAVNGRNIPVFLNFNNEGESKEGDAFVVGILLFWPALFMKGGEAKIAAGTSFLVQTTQDVLFDTSNLIQQQTNAPNITYEQLNKANPCGEKPTAPPTYNDPQYKQTSKYKQYQKELNIWLECTGN